MTHPQGRVAVIGAGIVGLSTAHAIAERGEAVVLYEAGTPGHGQSAAESRLFRHAHDDPRMIELARASRKVWTEWEQRFSRELVSGDGALALGESALERLEMLDEAGGIRACQVGADEATRRLPILTEFQGAAVFDPGAGAIRTRAAIAALSESLDGRIHSETGNVIALQPTEFGVEVVCTDHQAAYESVVVCAGRGTAGLAGSVGLALPVQLASHVRLEFSLLEPSTGPLACLQDSSEEFGESGIYAAPLQGGERYGVGLSDTAEASDSGSVRDPTKLNSHIERVCAYVRRALPGLDPDPVGQLNCWVTTVPWSDDGLAVWRHERLLFVAGHNLFKQAPELGRLLADAALTGDLDERLHPESRLGSPD